MSDQPITPVQAPSSPPEAADADAVQGLSIAAVERDTGLPKDTLRVWERRYGFPQPLRNAIDERLYPPDQVQKLQLLRRLLTLGHRPGRIVGLPRERLEAMVAEQTAGAGAAMASVAPGEHPAIGLEHFMQLLRGHDSERLRRELQQAHMRLGLQRFVTDLVAPLTTEVGAAWMRGELEVFEEHQFSEAIHRLLRSGIAAVPVAEHALQARPRVLLTTITQEPHGLGLLMVEAMLALEGCPCVSLGVQTPVADMLMAAQAHRSDIVALSFSALPTRSQVSDALGTLRRGLPAHVEIWVGGSSPSLARVPDGVQAIRSLHSLGQQVAAWRAAHPS